MPSLCAPPVTRVEYRVAAELVRPKRSTSKEGGLNAALIIHARSSLLTLPSPVHWGKVTICLASPRMPLLNTIRLLRVRIRIVRGGQTYLNFLSVRGDLHC